ncbi:MAG: MBL fold metallo-hydrolase [Clostridia bacterium]|nr:MBL fold metallo-hydrolase [Clostridia bacterium]
MEKLIQYATKASAYDGAFDSKAGWAAAGMGYILRTENGRLIAVDGGHQEDAEAFLELLEANSDGKPTVDFWIITHPHGDHYGALLELCRRPELAARVDIRTLIYHFPEEFRDARGNGIGYAFPHFEKILAVTEADPVVPKPDEIFETDGMRLHFLYTPTDCSILNNPNQLSLIFTAQGSGKKILFTGDAYFQNLEIVLRNCPDDMKCDILQLPHHGLCDTGDLEFYRHADADTVLIPISRAGDRTMHSDMYGDAPAANRYAEDHAHTVYKAFEGTAEIEL